MNIFRAFGALVAACLLASACYWRAADRDDALLQRLAADAALHHAR